MLMNVFRNQSLLVRFTDTVSDSSHSVLIVLSFMTQHTHEPPLISSSDGELQMAEILFFTHLHANVWVETTTEWRIPERMNIFALRIYNAHQTYISLYPKGQKKKSIVY